MTALLTPSGGVTRVMRNFTRGAAETAGRCTAGVGNALNGASGACSGALRLVGEQVTGLTSEGLAECRQRREADRPCASVLEHG
jgi:hypothetical protein